MDSLRPVLVALAEGRRLPPETARDAFALLMEGKTNPAQTAAFLMGLRLQGETVVELTAAVRVLRKSMRTVRAPENAIDVCGTGGDGKNTRNISTATQFVVAACGVPVAKHGNRAVSSRSGAADVLSALGVNIHADFPVVEKALKEVGTCFLLAPRHHPAMRHVGEVRRQLGIRTIFNVLGPLLNPACVQRQMVGVFSPDWVLPVAQTLTALGCKRAWVFHGGGGMDELSLSAPNHVAVVHAQEIRQLHIDSAQAGLKSWPVEALAGGDAAQNATALKHLLLGRKGSYRDTAYRDTVLLNAAAALLMTEVAQDLQQGVSLAAQAIDSGKALHVLEQLVEITNVR